MVNVQLSLLFLFSILILLLNFNIDSINEELIGCIKSIKSEEENENTEILDSKVIITSKANELNQVKSLTENMKECNIDHITNFNKSEHEESNSLQNKQINNLQNNNNVNTDCDIVCTNDNPTKIHEMNLKENNYLANSNDLLVMERETCKKEVYQFYQNLKSEIEKFNLNDQSPVKHIAHLEIEASKKKELEQIVAEFENKWINSPNPFSFIAELKKCIHDLDINFKYDN